MAYIDGMPIYDITYGFVCVLCGDRAEQRIDIPGTNLPLPDPDWPRGWHLFNRKWYCGKHIVCAPGIHQTTG
jgi:hypothetical protein